MAIRTFNFKPILLYCHTFTGTNKEFAEKINLKKYSGLFANGNKINEIVGELSIQELKDNWNLMYDKTIEVLNSLYNAVLEQLIVKIPKEHPFVRTRQDSISWNIKHNMWHCGQIGTLKRGIDKPHEFDL